jgi:hypothetical protein
MRLEIELRCILFPLIILEMFLQVDWSSGTGRIVRIEEKMNRAKYREILDENLLQSTQNLRLGQRFTFQQNNDPKHTAKSTQEWLLDKSLNVLECPGLEPDQTSLERSENSGAATLPIQPDRA